MEKAVKLGWLGDWYAQDSGFATVARNVLTRLKSTGIADPSQLAIGYNPVMGTGMMPEGDEKLQMFNTIMRAKDTWDVPFLYPKDIPAYEVKGTDTWASDCLRPWLARFPQEVMVVNADLWMCAWITCSQDNVNSYGSQFIFYQPIDSYCADGNLPIHYFQEKDKPNVRHPIPWAELMRRQHITVLYGDWAREKYLHSLPDFLQEDAAERCFVIPHGVDLSTFQPYPQHVARAWFEMPENMRRPDQAFMVGMVATNQARKNWPAIMRVMREFIKRHPNAYFWPWTQYWPGPMNGWHLDDLVRQHLPTDRVIRLQNLESGKRLPHDLVAKYMSAIDVHVLLHHGEGCGLPHLEAQACGKPAIATDFAGITNYFSDPFGRIKPIFGRIGEKNCLHRPESDEKQVLQKLEQLYASPELRYRLGRKGIKHARAHWNWDNLMPLWERVITVAKRGYDERQLCQDTPPTSPGIENVLTSHALDARAEDASPDENIRRNAPEHKASTRHVLRNNNGSGVMSDG